METGVRDMGSTHDVGMIETLEHSHLTPHALLVPLDFLLRNRLQCDLTRDITRRGRRGGTSRGRDGERGSGTRVWGGGGGGRRGWAGRAALREGPLFWWYVPCRTLPWVTTMMWYGVMVVCETVPIFRACLHLRGFSHVP